MSASSIAYEYCQRLIHRISENRQTRRAKQTRRNTQYQAQGAICESLENRVLLSGDLAVAYVDDSWAALTIGVDPDADGPATAYGTDAFATIQEAIDNLQADGTIHVADGTYNENLSITQNLTLLSDNGRDVTFINGISGVGALGAITISNTTSDVQIGDIGQGFTILGIDNGAPGIENAAVYLQGSHSGMLIIGNEIIANGEAGLLSEYSATIDNILVDSNIFSGQTFNGANPAGEGFGQQFSLDNVPRQLVNFGGGSGSNNYNIFFSSNQITGTAGGLNASAQEQGNTLVTIDAHSSAIINNTFAGTTTRYGSALRVRGSGATTIQGNTFDSTNMGDNTSMLETQIGTINGYITINNKITAFDNDFDGGAYLTGGITVVTTIEGIIENAPDGSTINILAGQYEADITITHNDITVYGPNGEFAFVGSAARTRNGEAEITGGFRVQGDNATIAGLTILNGVGPLGIGDITAIHLAADTTGHTIANNIIIGTDAGGSRGIVASSPAGIFTVQNNDISAWTSGMYINPGSDGVQVLTNNIHDNFVGMSADNATNLTIANNFFANNSFEHIGLGAPGAGVVANENSFDTNGPSVSNYGGVEIDASNNWWGTTDLTLIGNNLTTNASGPVDYSPFLNNGTDLLTHYYGFQPDLSSQTAHTSGSQTVGVIDEVLGSILPDGDLNLQGNFSGDLLIGNGITLGGDFTLDGTLTLTDGATLAPGNSPAIVNTGNLTMGTGETLAIELFGTTPGTEHDQVNVTGLVNIAGATLDVDLQYLPQNGDSWVIVNNDGTDPIVGTFDNMWEGKRFTVDGIDFVISYVGGDGNDIELSLDHEQFDIIYVDDDWAGTTPGTDPDGYSYGISNIFGFNAFASVADAAQAANQYGRVNIASGTYNDDVIVERTMFFYGPYENIDPDDVNRTDEAIINGGFELLAPMVTFNGLTIANGSVSTTTGDTAAIHIASGISGPMIYNSIITGSNAAGSYGIKTNGPTSFSVSYSEFSNWGTAIEINANGVLDTVAILNSNIHDNQVGLHADSTQGNLTVAMSYFASNTVEHVRLDNIFKKPIFMIDSFDANSPSITNNSPTLVDASFNYWGTSDLDLIAANLIANANGPVDYSPVFNNDIQDPAATGYGFNPLTNDRTAHSFGAQTTGLIPELLLFTDPGFHISLQGIVNENAVIGNGLTLSGEFTLNGTLTLTDGATLAPGNSPAIVNTGSLTMGTGETLAIELFGTTPGTEYDQVNVTGTVDIAGSTLDLTLGYFPSTTGDNFTIINNDGTDAIVGTFAGLAEGATFIISNGGADFNASISYVGGDGNDVVITTEAYTLNNVYVDDDWASLTIGVDPDDAGPAKAFGFDAFATIQEALAALNGLNYDRTVHVADGNYTGDALVQDHIRLDGSFTLDGTLTVDASAKLLQVYEPNLIHSGDLTLGLPSILYIRINGSNPGTEHSQIDVTGTVDVTYSTFDFASIYLNYTPAVDEAFVIIDNDGTDAITGTFKNVAEGTLVRVQDHISDSIVPLYVTYHGGDGNDLALVRNAAPIALYVTMTISEDDTSANGTFIADDANADDDPSTLTYTIRTSPAQGSVTNNHDGTFTFVPGSDFQDMAQGESRQVSFEYLVNDSHSMSAINTVTFTVTGVNDLPTASNVAVNAVEDGPTVDGNFAGADTDTNDTLSYSILTSPTEGSVINNNDGTFTFAPGSDFQDLALGETRDVSFTYIATDNNSGESSTATVTITVTGVNDLPAANNVADTTDEDHTVAASFDGSDIDTNDSLTYAIVTGPNAGAVTNHNDGTFTYDPQNAFQNLAASESAEVTFTYKVTDNHSGESSTATVTITVTGVNDLPTAGNVTGNAVEDGPTVDGNFAGSDADTNDTLTYTILSSPTEGSVINNNDGTFTFDPGSDFQDLALGETRDVSFTYKATDNHSGESSTATVTITVSGVNEVIALLAEVYVDDDWATLTIGADPDGAGPLVGFGYDSFATITDALAAVTSGGTVNVLEGTYVENLSLDQAVQLRGAGSGLTILEGGSAIGIDITAGGISAADADRLLISGLTINNTASMGIVIDDSVSFITIDDVDVNVAGVKRTDYGLEVGANGVVTDLKITNSAFSTNNQGAGMHIHGSVDGLTITDSAFDGNNIGFYAFQVDNSGTVLTNVNISDSSFSDNTYKGLYIEKLSNAVLDNLTVSNAGTLSGTTDGLAGYEVWPIGIDLNLKYYDYTNVTIQNSSITNSGSANPSNGSGFAVKTRNDGGYATHPATLDGLTVTNNFINGAQTSIRIGEPGKGNTGLSNVLINDNDLSGSLTGNFIDNQSVDDIDASSNWFGITDIPTIAAGINGSVDFSPILASGTDTQPATAGFQPDHTALISHASGSQTTGLIQEAIDAIEPNGTLTLDGTINESITVGNGITVKGNFTLNGTLTLEDGATLAPGNSPAIVNVGGLVMGSGETLDIELFGTTPGTEHDQVNVTGTVDITDATLNVVLSYLPASTDSFVIVNNDGNDAIVGTFAGLAEGDAITLDGVILTISYVGGDGNDITLSAASSFDVIYVDDDWAGTANGDDPDAGGPAGLFGYNAFATISQAIAAVNSGGTIYVNDGTYTQALTINKSMSLLGANADVDPTHGGSRNAESTITNNVTITADDVVFNGFELTGYNYNGLTIGGQVSNVTVSYNYVHGSIGGNSAILLAPDAGSTLAGEVVALTNIDITNNYIVTNSAINNQVGIRFSGPAYTHDVLYNQVTLDSNEITGVGTGHYGIFSGASPAGYSMTDAVITNNYIHDVASGINLGNMYNGLVDGNIIDGTSGTGTSLGVINGSITNNTYLNIGSQLTSGGTAAIGIWGTEYGFTATTNATITGNVIHFNDNALATVSGIYTREGADSDNIHINENSFINGLAGSSAFAVANWSLDAGTLDASNNWWSTTIASEVQALATDSYENETSPGVFETVYSGKVDTSPFLESGTDIDGGTAGFQGDFSALTVHTQGDQTSGLIQEGIDSVDVAGTVHVFDGTYVENVNVNKYADVIGTGSGSVTLDANGARGFNFTAGGDSNVSRMDIDGFTIINASNGLYTDSTVSYITIDDVTVQNSSSYGFEVHNNAVINDLVIANSSFSTGSLSVGMRVRGSVDGLAITNTNFDNNSQGFISVAGNDTFLNNVNISDSTFSNNTLKGIYLEKLNNGTFDHITIDQSGTAGNSSAGFDINLKYDDFANITIQNSTISNSGTGDLVNGVGLAVKARDDGSYASNPATLDGVTITNNFFSDNQTNLRFGEPGKDNAGPTNVTVFENSITGSISGTELNNQTLADINASNNWWGSTDEAIVAASIAGSVDFSPYLESGTDTDLITNGFQGDFSALTVTDEGSQTTNLIYEGITNVDVNGTVHVAAGTYDTTSVDPLYPAYPVEHLTVDKTVNLLGANAGVNPNTQTRGEETSIIGTIFVTADNVRIDGFEMTGGFDALSITDVAGKLIIDNGATGTTLQNLYVHDVDFGVGPYDRHEIILLGDESANGGSADNTTIIDSRIAGSIFLYQNSFATNPTVWSDILIQNNDLSSGSISTGSKHDNYSLYYSLDNIHIHDNQIGGMSLRSLDGGLIDNNVFTGSIKVSGSSTVSNNTFTGSGSLTLGLFDDFQQSGTGLFDVTNNFFQFNTPDVAEAIFVHYFSDANTIHINQNSFVNGHEEVDANAVINHSFLDDSSHNYGILDLSNNWWDTTDVNQIVDLTYNPYQFEDSPGVFITLAKGLVDTSPFLESGTDTDLVTPGFQGDFSALTVHSSGAQTTGLLDEGLASLALGGTLTVLPGSYSDDLIVPSGTTVAGEFTTTGTVTFLPGSIFSPGYSPAIANTGDLVMASGSILDIELFGTTPGTEHDQVNVTGTVDITDATLNVILGYSPTVGDSYVIINNDGSDTITGNFAGLAEGDFVVIGDVTMSISYVGGDGNDVALTTLAITVPTDVYVDDNWIGMSLGVDPDGSDPATLFGYDAFATIQDAIDAVADGGTVHVLAGNYDEYLTVNRSMTVTGESGDAADVVIAPTFYNSTLVAITVSSTTGPVALQNMSINTSLAYILIGIAASGTGGTGNDLTITNVDLSNATGSGIIGIGVSNYDGLVTIDSSTIDGFDSNSITITGSDVILSGNTMTGSEVYGVHAINANLSILNNQIICVETSFHDAYSIYLDGGTALIQGNDLRFSNNGIYITNGALVDAGDYNDTNVTGMGTGSMTNGSSNGHNLLSNTAIAINNQNTDSAGAPDVLAQMNYFGVFTAPEVEAKVHHDTDDSALTVVDYGSFLTQSTDVYVDDDWASLSTGVDPDGSDPATSFGYDAFATITEAINAVADGGTVHVADGTYIENITVNDNLTIHGTFTLDGTITIDSGATLSPGNSPGLIYTGNLVLGSGAILDEEINGTTAGTEYDQVDVTGTVDITDAILNVTLGYNPTGNTEFVIINNDGSDAVTGTFAGLAEGDTIVINGEHLIISYVGGDGNDVTLSVVSFMDVYVDDDWTGLTLGADPDGAGPATKFGFDAFATIQEAVDAVADAGTVHVYDGYYAEEVTINHDLTITGVSLDATGVIIDGLSSYQPINIIGTTDVTLEYFTVTNGNDDNIDINDAGTVTIDHVISTNAAEDGFDAENTDTLIVTNSTIDLTTDDGIDTDGVDHVTITNTVITRSGGSGMELYNGFDLTIENTAVDQSTEFGMDIFFVDDTYLTDVTVTNAGYDGIWIEDGLLAQLTRVTSQHNVGDGIYITFTQTIELLDSNASYNGYAGLNVEYAQTLTDTNGIYTENEDSGIILSIVLDQTTLTRTTATNNNADFGDYGAGLEIYGDLETPGGYLSGLGGDVLIQGGTFSDTDNTPYLGNVYSQTDGIYIEGIAGSVDIVAHDNGSDIQTTSVRGNDELGVGVYGINGHVNIEDADISRNYGHGLDIDQTGDVTVTDSSFIFNNGFGIWMTNVQDIILSGLDVQLNHLGILVTLADTFTDTNSLYANNSYAGMKVNNIDVLNITGTSVIDNGAQAIRLTDINDANLTQLTLTGNDVGVEIQDFIHAFDLTNSFINDNRIGFYVNELYHNFGLTLFDNDLSGNSEYAILNGDTGPANTQRAVGASGNWFGSIEEVTIAAMLSGLVDFTPYLATGTDTSPDTGFQGDFSNLYVTTLGEQTTSLTGRLQEAVDLVTSNGIIFMNTGVYNEDVTVNENKILKGTGTVNGTITLVDSAQFLPGTSPGAVTMTNLVGSTGMNYTADIDGTTPATEHDQLIVTGHVTLNGMSLISELGYDPAAGDTVTLIDNQGTDAIEGTFADMPEGALITLDGALATITYTGGDGNDVQVIFNGPNTAPIAEDVQAVAVEDGAPVTLAFKADDANIDDSTHTLIFELLSIPREGKVTNNGNGTFNFDPGKAFQDLGVGETRNVTFTYQATDSHGVNSSVQTITITVQGTNDAPVAAPSLVNTQYQTALNIDVLKKVTDIDGDILQVSGIETTPGSSSLVGTSNLGVTITINDDGTIHYDPTGLFDSLAPGQTVRDAFRYVVTDPYGLSDRHVVFIDVTRPMLTPVTASSMISSSSTYSSSAPVTASNMAGSSAINHAALAFVSQQAQLHILPATVQSGHWLETLLGHGGIDQELVDEVEMPAA